MNRHAVAIALWTAVASLVASAQNQPPARDTAAQTQAAKPIVATARVSGRIVSADTGRPLIRVRVILTSAALSGARMALTGSDGAFQFTDLPAGRYTLNAAKTGFVTIAYGQRRPLQAGTPLDITDGQSLTGLDMLLPRGSAIAGHITDETGETLPGAAVRVARYQYRQGTRVLSVVGTAQTDDQGAYRVWGLDPGTYYVSALARIPIVPPLGQILEGPPGAPGARGGRGFAAAGPGGRGALAPLLNAAGDLPDTEAYAPTFYPGVPSLNDARPIVVGLGAETTGIDFGVLLVRTGRLSGRVTRADGAPASGGNVVLLPEGNGRGGGRENGGRINREGNFALLNIPPGRYILQARSNDREAPGTAPQSARQPVSVSEGDQVTVAMALALPGGLSGTVRFSTSASTAPDPSLFRVAAPPADPSIAGGGQARVQRDGTFTLPSIEAGPHWIRGGGSQAGWALTSVVINGRETIDMPVDVRSGQTLSGVTLTFSDRLTSLSGTLTDGRGAPLTGYTVLAFPADTSLWRPQARQIMTTRPDQNGKYQLKGLPAGSYYLTAIDPEQQGEWYEPEFLEAHRTGAARVTLADGDVKTQDFSLAQP